MTRTVRSTGTAARRTSLAGALVVLAGLLAACGGTVDGEGAEGEDDPSASESADAASPDDTASEGSASEDADETEETGEPEDLEPTPPDTVLDPDEPAIVEVVYTGSGRGLYELELVSVEEEPLSSLPPDVPADPGSTLYYVTHDWTMLDRGTGNVQGMNLLSQTSVSVGRDFQILPLLFAETPGCRTAQFRPEDGTSGKTRRSCVPYLLPPGDQVEQVWFYEVNSPYDFSTGGAPVRWRVDV